MGISKYVFAAVFACFAFGSLQGADVSSKQQKKHYLTKRMLKLTKKGITIKTNKGLANVSALRSDAKGMFVYRSDICIKGTGDPHPCAGDCNGNHPTTFGRDHCEASDWNQNNYNP